MLTDHILVTPCSELVNPVSAAVLLATPPAAAEMALDVAEHPAKPRKRTLSFYIVFFAVVIPLQSTLPASWLFVIYALRFRNVMSLSGAGRIVFLVALCEVGPIIVVRTQFGTDPARYYSAYIFTISLSVSQDLPPVVLETPLRLK